MNVMRPRRAPDEIVTPRDAIRSLVVIPELAKRGEVLVSLHVGRDTHGDVDDWPRAESGDGSASDMLETNWKIVARMRDSTRFGRILERPERIIWYE